MVAFNSTYVVDQRNIQRTDWEIYQYILRYPNGDYADVLRTTDAWDALFHLSELRTALLGWYKFKKDADILEVGAGFGALTGYLSQQAAHVTAVENSLFRAKALVKRYAMLDNLDVYAGCIEDIAFDRQFDYIVLTDTSEWLNKGRGSSEAYSDYLMSLKRLLKNEGKLLIAVDNRYGLKYFCGEIDIYSEKAFYRNLSVQKGGWGQGLSRQELQDVLHKAGILHYKFYYPLPDHRFTQVVYSDNHLPGRELFERITPYYRSKETLIASELDLYEDILHNHVFEFFANSFFVECGDFDDFCPVEYAVVTADRGKKDSIVTSMHGQNQFIKKALYPEGKSCMEKLHKNMQQLARHGLRVIPYDFIDQTMVMPYIRKSTLADYLRGLQEGDKEKVFCIFDKLWDMILKSSSVVAPQMNILLEKAPAADWGPVLRETYLEMIPMNCFYHDEIFEFFDQEFARENCPAKYPMFRAILYSYGYLSHIVTLQELQQRYALTAVWPVLQQEEDHFHEVLRHHDVYHQFCKWAWSDSEKIERNIEIINSFRSQESLDSVLQKDSFELYSFDVFDTLITRRTATPKGIFALLQEELKKNSQDGAFPSRIKENFYDFRRYYENMTSREMCDEEIGDITLNDIYRVFGKGEQLNQEQISALADMERFLEYENIVGIPENIEHVKKLKKQGKRVVLISNMYMEEETLHKLLVIVDPIFQDIPMYISSKYKKRKETQQLYEVVKKKENIDFINWVHCGDDHRADIDVPASMGIKTVYFNGAALTEQEKKVIYAQEKDIELQMHIGSIKNARVLARGVMGRREAIPIKHYGMAEDFPCGILHDRVALYGAGKCGQDLHKKLKDYAHVEIVVWVDKNFIAAQNKGLPVAEPGVLSDREFDDIIIAISNTTVADEVKEQLISLGIDKHKIVHFI